MEYTPYSKQAIISGSAMVAGANRIAQVRQLFTLSNPSHMTYDGLPVDTDMSQKILEGQFVFTPVKSCTYDNQPEVCSNVNFILMEKPATPESDETRAERLMRSIQILGTASTQVAYQNNTPVSNQLLYIASGHTPVLNTGPDVLPARTLFSLRPPKKGNAAKGNTSRALETVPFNPKDCVPDIIGSFPLLIKTREFRDMWIAMQYIDAQLANNYGARAAQLQALGTQYDTVIRPMLEELLLAYPKAASLDAKDNGGAAKPLSRVIAGGSPNLPSDLETLPRDVLDGVLPFFGIMQGMMMSRIGGVTMEEAKPNKLFNGVLRVMSRPG